MTIGGHQDISEILCELLKYARPGGRAHLQITKYLDMSQRNVFLGPRANQTIQKLIDLYDRVGCDNLLRAEHVCMKTGVKCPHSEVYRSCKDYEPLRRKIEQGGSDDC